MNNGNVMDQRLRITLKLSVPGVIVASIGPVVSVIDYGYTYIIDVAPYLLCLVMFPFFLLSVYLSLRGSCRAIVLWLGMLSYYLYVSTFIARFAFFMKPLSLLSFSLIFSSIIAGITFLRWEEMEFKFPNKIPVYAAVFIFLLCIFSIIAPIVEMHALYPFLYKTVSHDSSFYNRIFTGNPVFEFLYYDGRIEGLFSLDEPHFLFLRPEVSLFMLIPLYCAAIYLLIRGKKSGYMISLILLVINGISLFLFGIPPVAMKLKEYSSTVFHNITYMLSSGTALDRLVVTVIDMKLILLFVCSFLSAILVVYFMRYLVRSAVGGE